MIQNIPGKKVLLTRIPEELHKEIKLLAVQNDTTIAEYVSSKLVACRILACVAMGHLYELKQSIKTPDDILVKDYKNRTAAHYAARHGFIDILRFIKKINGKLDETDEDGKKPIDYAEMNGHAECVAFFESENIKQWD